MLKQLYPPGRLMKSGGGRRSNKGCGTIDFRFSACESRAARKRPNLERLESRHMLSSSSSPIASVEPYNGQQLTQSPQDLVVTFNGVNVPALMGNFDVQIEELNRDGSRTPLWDFGDAPPEFSDITGAELIVPLQKFDDSDFSYDNVTLPAGQYEIDLVGGTSISYAAAGAYGPGPLLWDPTQDHAIGTFSISGLGATIGPWDSSLIPGQTTWGWLDPSNPPSAVDLYKFTLPPGNLWQVGLGISAKGIGSPLLTDLSLFSADGTLLATSNAGTGIPSNPNDPYLFNGLEGGTYYVGVSGAGNLPYSQGGYDPVLGIPGFNGQDQGGGLFALNLVTSPHEQATRVTSFSLDYAGPAGTGPTGFTMTFSGPVDLSNLFIPDSQETALDVLSSTGRAWPVTAESYEVSTATLQLIFDRPLPAGNYTLVSTSGDGLVDLAGQPVLPVVGSSSALANWSVSPTTQPLAANNLGVLWPLSSSQTGATESGSLHGTNELAPGQGVDYSFTVIVPGFHELTTQISGGDIAISITENGVTSVLASGNQNALTDYLMRLNDGVYTLHFVNIGPQSSTLNWRFKIETLDWEKILNNGVSQTSALSLSLFSAPAGDSGGSGDLNSAGSTGGIAALFGAGSGANFAGSMGPIPSTLVVTLNTGLIGAPVLASQNVLVVGPLVDGGTSALASSGNSLDPGARYESALNWSDWLGNGPLAGELKPAGSQPVQADPAVVTASLGNSARLDSETNTARADGQAMGRAELLLGLGARVQGWLGAAFRVGNDQSAANRPVATNLLAQNELTLGEDRPKEGDQIRRERSTAQFDLGAATCAILVGAALCKLRRPIFKWWQGHHRMLTASGGKSSLPAHRGPHALVTRSQARTRRHVPKALR